MADPLSINTSIITLLDTAKKVYDKVQNATHLPQPFSKTYARIDLATETLFKGPPEILEEYRRREENQGNTIGMREERGRCEGNVRGYLRCS